MWKRRRNSPPDVYTWKMSTRGGKRRATGDSKMEQSKAEVSQKQRSACCGRRSPARRINSNGVCKASRRTSGSTKYLLAGNTRNCGTRTKPSRAQNMVPDKPAPDTSSRHINPTRKTDIRRSSIHQKSENAHPTLDILIDFTRSGKVQQSASNQHRTARQRLTSACSKS